MCGKLHVALVAFATPCSDYEIALSRISKNRKSLIALSDIGALTFFYGGSNRDYVDFYTVS